MSDILFVTWDGGGNLPPALSIAAELTRRGHVVRFLGHVQQRARIEESGYAFEAFRHARAWDSVGPNPGMLGLLRTVAVFTDRGIGEDLLDAVRRHQPDRVVVDCLLFGALEAAERADLDPVALVHMPYGQMHTTWSGGMGRLLTGVKGLHPVDLWNRSQLVLLATLPAIDDCGVLPQNFERIGPIWQGVRPEPASPSGEEPLVVASLSTIYQDGQVKALQAVVDGLAQLPVRSLVTTGPSISPTQLTAPANVDVRAFVPHIEVLPRASLMISHGGHSTTMTALGYDLPLVIMPMFAKGDQPVIGRALERLGAARVVAKNAPAERIVAVVTGMLQSPPIVRVHKRSARRFASAMALWRRLTPLSGSSHNQFRQAILA